MLQVRVTVLDKNDVAPTWGSGPWKFKISEEAPPNTVVTVLKAHDPDTIGTLTYTLVPNHRRHRHRRPDNYTEPFAKNNNNNNVANDADDFDDGSQQFQLHPTTGQLTLAEVLDRETKEKYVLRVRADDGLQHRDIVLNIQVRMCYTCTDIRNESLINKHSDIKSILYRVNIKNSLNYRRLQQTRLPLFH